MRYVILVISTVALLLTIGGCGDGKEDKRDPALIASEKLYDQLREVTTNLKKLDPKTDAELMSRQNKIATKLNQLKAKATAQKGGIGVVIPAPTQHEMREAIKEAEQFIADFPK